MKSLKSIPLDPALLARCESQRGFTLIEMMITVAIIGILAAIAYPAYTDSILKGKRAEGRTALTALLQQQERYLTMNGQYLLFNGPSDSNNASVGLKSFSGDAQASSAYTLGAANCQTNPDVKSCVMVFATPVKTDSQCGVLTITSVGIVRGYGSQLTIGGSGSSTAVSGTPTANSSSNRCWN